MDIAWFRDLVICIAGLVMTVVVILIGVLSYFLYTRVRAILNSIQATSTNIHEISSAVKDDIVKPVVQLVALVRGISQGIDIISRFFKKEQ
ncbi:MAG: hypothetical protein FJ023_09015 [Chloroflexi bacterium]|nr:hypothetical protein [Chloroflexota bacterium]